MRREKGGHSGKKGDIQVSFGPRNPLRRKLAENKPECPPRLCIIADLDELAGFPPQADAEEAKGEDAEARRVRHRRSLAEPDPPPKRLSMREERAMLRALLDLPPSERG